jgi:DNA-binding response OmpR family regulator
VRILVVEDEIRLATLLQSALLEEGYGVDVVHSGEDALAWLRPDAHDALVLDIMLPGLDGLAVCRQLRRQRIRLPILLLTARDTVPDRVAGLDAGADDYLVKPFALAELLARLRALTRRPPAMHQPILAAGTIRLDPATRQAWRANQPVPLSNKEFRILEYLMRNAGQVMTRDMIANHVWNYEFSGGTNVIDVHIRSLRRKLGLDANDVIETVRGAGYRVRSGS